MPAPVLWPGHWYGADGNVRCIVPNCPFFTQSPRSEQQWTDLNDHCREMQESEHGLLEAMLKQTICAIDGCSYEAPKGKQGYKRRRLFEHEQSTHHSAAMSNICSFVTLAREGRIIIYPDGTVFGAADKSYESIIFNRMLEKVRALPSSWTDVLFGKNGFKHRGEHTDANLRDILARDISTPAGENPNQWRPVPTDDFLSHCHPDPYDPADGFWYEVWEELRNRYANGQI